MGFIDEAAGGGGPPIMKFNKEARYAKSGSDESFNDQEFVADLHAPRGRYIKFGEKGQAPLALSFQTTRRRCALHSAIPIRASGSRVGSAMTRKTPGQR